MKKVALVEDNPDNRLLARAILEDFYDIVEYANGPDALSGMSAEPPDLLLLDISLPGMDGSEVLRHVRADPTLCAIPAIALTAHAMSGDRERYLEQGFDAYVPKPIVDEQVLLDEIARLLAGD